MNQTDRFFLELTVDATERPEPPSMIGAPKTLSRELGPCTEKGSEEGMLAWDKEEEGEHTWAALCPRQGPHGPDSW